MIETLRMGKMFGLASLWESRGSEKINGETKYAMAQGVPIPRTTVSFPRPNTKRKRDDGVEEIVLEEEKQEKPSSAKRMRQETATPQSKLPKSEKLVETTPPVVDEFPPEAAPKEASTTNMDSTSNLDALRGIIESQLGLEILLKHGELRLINQEIAKCQIALEQLRRCHLIPYPISKKSPFDPVSVSDGTAPAIEPEKGMPRPEWAPGYGVADGPYTRHYAKWLIPDPKFDGIQPDWTFGGAASRGNRQAAEGRTTRNSLADPSTPVGTRAKRGSTTQGLQALSSGYPPPKTKGICILKRNADGQLVQLLCKNCDRVDYSNTQGFINHCRIAHRVDYKSHEEAAIVCGHPIKINEAGEVVGEQKTPAPASGLVHPLINSAPTDQEAYRNIMTYIGASVGRFRRGELPGVTTIPGAASNPSTPNVKAETNRNENFVPSSDAPFLSDLLENRGFDGDLDEIVTESRKKVDKEEPLSKDEEDSDAEKRLPSLKGGLFDGSSDFQPPPQMRVPARTTISPAPFGRPVSSKGLDRNKSGISPRLPYATPINTTAANHSRHSLRIIDSSSSTSEKTHHNDSSDPEADTNVMISDLSPNTVASNNDLPALVSDDGEYEDEDNDDGKSLASEIDEGEDSDVAEISIEDGESAETAVVARAAGRRMRKEDRHVTFVSPVKNAKGRKKDGRGRK